jgi:hypothetical protein
MERKEYLERQREALLKSFLTAEGDYKKEILRKIINIDAETSNRDTYGVKKPGRFTLKKNRFIYLR